MNLSLTNNAEHPEAIGTPDGSWIDVLTPGTPLDVNQDAPALILGEVADSGDNFTRAVAAMPQGMTRHLIEIARSHRLLALRGDLISITILNRGPEPVQATLGAGPAPTVVDIAPGGSKWITATGSIELRTVAGQAADDPEI